MPDTNQWRVDRPERYTLRLRAVCEKNSSPNAALERYRMRARPRRDAPSAAARATDAAPHRR
jgi:hypothetical protein